MSTIFILGVVYSSSLVIKKRKPLGGGRRSPWRKALKHLDGLTTQIKGRVLAYFCSQRERRTHTLVCVPRSFSQLSSLVNFPHTFVLPPPKRFAT